jgi:hypothetical protein
MEPSWPMLLAKAQHAIGLTVLVIIGLGSYGAAFRRSINTRSTRPNSIRLAMGLALSAAFAFGLILDLPQFVLATAATAIIGAALLSLLDGNPRK